MAAGDSCFYYLNNYDFRTKAINCFSKQQILLNFAQKNGL